MADREKYLTPCGYYHGNGGIVLAVIFSVWCAVIVAVSMSAGAGFIEVAPFVLVAVVFVTGAVLSDITSKSKARKKNEYRMMMQKNERVSGEIIKLEQRPYLLGHEMAPEKLKLVDGYTYNYKSRDRAYRVFVKYTDPFDKKEKTVMSELYTWIQMNEFNKEAFKSRRADYINLVVRDDFADVFVSPDGKAWVELIMKQYK